MMTSWQVSEVRLYAAQGDSHDYADIPCSEVIEQDYEWKVKVGADSSIARSVRQEAGLTVRSIDSALLPLGLDPTDISFTDDRTGTQIRRHVHECRQIAPDAIWLAIRGPQPPPGSPGP